MGNLLRQAQEMQRELDRVKGELRDHIVEGTAGGGVVRIELTADRHEVKKLEIDDKAFEQSDKAAVEELVLAALRDALRKAELHSTEAMGKLTGGMNLPGFF